jgi:NAD(P)-dependent dehydrogenase (short-subunit alcohol dehydrogenase family)
MMPITEMTQGSIMHNEFQDKVAVITGASSGIGLKLTEELLTARTKVVAMSRDIGGLGVLAERHGDNLRWIPGDVTKPADLERLAHLVSMTGRVDYLVPNAGIAMLAEGTNTESFKKQWEVNGAGALNTLAVLRDQLSAPASVVFIGTFLSRLAFPGLAGYIASKSALISHSRTLAVELASSGVRVNVVSPGPTATPIWGTLGLGEDDLRSVAKTVNERLLSGQFLEPDAVAAVVKFLLSEDARGIYGQEIVVDGGFTLG